MDLPIVKRAIELKTRPFDTKSFLDTLVKNFVITRGTRQLLDTCLASGGFIAGGFVRLALHNFGAHMVDEHLTFEYGYYEDQKTAADKMEKDALWGLTKYLRSHDTVDKLDRFKSGKNDIDVFFPDKGSLASFVKTFGWDATKFIVNESPAGNALTILCDNRVVVQLITRFTAPVDEMLSSFDIINGAVAITSDSVVFPQQWFELERERVIRVNHWSHDQTIRRVARWGWKHELETLHPDDIEHYNAKLMEMFDRIHTDGKIEVENGLVIYDMPSFLKSLNHPSFLKNVDGAMLVLLSSMASIYDDYNWAFTEFKNRSSILQQVH